MALISCPDCGKEISDKATVCQNCGFPIKKHLLGEQKSLLRLERERVLNNNKRPIRVAIYSLAVLITIAIVGFSIVDANNKATQTYKRSALSFLSDMQEDVTNVKNKSFYTSISLESYLSYQEAERESIVRVWGEKEKFDDTNSLIDKCYDVYKKILYSTEPNSILTDKDIEELVLIFYGERQKAEQLIKRIK